jgi:hypothetical protein
LRRLLPLVAALGLVVLSCDAELGNAGDPCTTSTECGPGLLCDSAQEPKVCARMGAPRPDLAGVDQAQAPVDFAGLDLFGVDLAATEPDLSGAVVDMATIPDLISTD